MASHYRELAGRLRSGHQGEFVPFTYTIALQGSVVQALQSGQDYPLQKPVSDKVMRQFESSLTFWHEAAHLSQYVSTSFGLRTLRRSLVSLRYMLEGGPWQLPVGQWLWDLPQRTDHQTQAMGRFLNFLDAIDQVQLHDGQADEMPDPLGPDTQLLWEPWSPYLFWGVTREWIQAQPRAPKFRQPILWVRGEDNAVSVVLNGAALMEGFALLVELNHLHSAFGLGSAGWEELVRFAPSGNGYLAALYYGFDQDAFTYTTMIPVLTACIDLALMYDPFVLYNSPNLEMPEPGIPSDQYPGETFIHACAAASHISPPNGWDDFGRFYAELCDYMDLPSPEWMARRAYDVVTKISSTVGSAPVEDVWLGAAIDMHVAALKQRVQNPLGFAGTLLTSNGSLDVFEACVPHVSFYNLGTGEPEGTYQYFARNIDLLSLHTLMRQALTQRHIDCPLKLGVPFSCPSALSDSNTLCVFPLEDGTRRECLLDIFEQQCGLR